MLESDVEGFRRTSTGHQGPSLDDKSFNRTSTGHQGLSLDGEDFCGASRESEVFPPGVTSVRRTSTGCLGLLTNADGFCRTSKEYTGLPHRKGLDRTPAEYQGFVPDVKGFYKASRRQRVVPQELRASAAMGQDHGGVGRATLQSGQGHVIQKKQDCLGKERPGRPHGSSETIWARRDNDGMEQSAQRCEQASSASKRLGCPRWRGVSSKAQDKYLQPQIPAERSMDGWSEQFDWQAPRILLLDQCGS